MHNSKEVDLLLLLLRRKGTALKTNNEGLGLRVASSPLKGFGIYSRGLLNYLNYCGGSSSKNGLMGSNTLF